MSHTLGPWFVVPDPQWEGKHPNHASRYVCNVPEFAEVHPPVEGENRDWNIFHDQHGKTVCLMTDTLEITANANLIASAPDLLAALNRLIQSLPEDSNEYPDSASARQVFDSIEFAREAVSKATGGAA